MSTPVEANAVVAKTTPPALISSMPSAQEMMVYQTWAKSAFDSQMYRTIGKESAIMMIMLAAREFGIGPAQALNGGLHIIEGKVELSARIMSALIRRAKHTLKILEDTDKKCVIYGRRADTGEEHTVTYTIEMAQTAGLIKDKGGWKKVPDDMLFARAMSKLARRLFSDVIGIGYVEGEISDPGANNEVLEVLPEAESSDEAFNDLLQHFAPQDHDLVREFVCAVMEHYHWHLTETINRLREDIPGTSTKFQSWKQKRKK
jgi:hypothetical protein